MRVTSSAATRWRADRVPGAGRVWLSPSITAFDMRRASGLDRGTPHCSYFICRSGKRLAWSVSARALVTRARSSARSGFRARASVTMASSEASRASAASAGGSSAARAGVIAASRAATAIRLWGRTLGIDRTPRARTAGQSARASTAGARTAPARWRLCGRSAIASPGTLSGSRKQRRRNQIRNDCFWSDERTSSRRCVPGGGMRRREAGGRNAAAAG